jgi:hypothetical protein
MIADSSCARTLIRDSDVSSARRVTGMEDYWP